MAEPPDFQVVPPATLEAFLCEVTNGRPKGDKRPKVKDVIPAKRAGFDEVHAAVKALGLDRMELQRMLFEVMHRGDKEG